VIIEEGIAWFIEYGCNYWYYWFEISFCYQASSLTVWAKWNQFILVSIYLNYLFQFHHRVPERMLDVSQIVHIYNIPGLKML